MEKGKRICRQLRKIRRQIARENDIALVTTECRHKGSCLGTCPKCEAEIRYLEEQLAERKRLGRATRITGVALGLATIAPALFTSCDPTERIDVQGDIPAPYEQTDPTGQ